MSVSMDEINFLIWRYMQENGFPHSAFIFDTESLASATNIPSALVPPGALITLLQKSLIYLRIQKTIHRARGSPDPAAQSELDQIRERFPSLSPASPTYEGIEPTPLSSPDFIQLASPELAPLTTLTWSLDGEKLATLHANGCAFIWSDHFQTQIPIGGPGPPLTRYRHSIQWNHKSDMVAVCADSQTNVYDLKGESAFSIPVVATVVAFHPTEPIIVTCSRANYEVVVWFVENASAVQMHRYPLHRDAIITITWRDGSVFATGSLDKCVGLFSSENQQTLRGHTLSVTSVQFFDEHLLASGSEDGSIIVWTDGHQRSILRGHVGGISCLAWHPDSGNLLASGSADGTVKIWDLEKGEPLATIARHSKGVTALAFHRDGATVVTGGADGIVAIWRWQERKMMAAFQGEAPIVTIDLDQSGRMLAVCTESPLATVISLDQLLA
jgi:transducin (beta)-like 1